MPQQVRSGETVAAQKPSRVHWLQHARWNRNVIDGLFMFHAGLVTTDVASIHVGRDQLAENRVQLRWGSS